MNHLTINTLTKHTEGLSLLDSLIELVNHSPDEVVFSLGFGKEGMVIADTIFRYRLPIRVFTLDTGRLFPETYELFDKVVNRYKAKIEVYFPDTEDVQYLVSNKGPSSFYNSVEDRKECCAIRKLHPLKRALMGSDIWISGLRREQSAFRAQAPKVQWDERHQVIKFHPLIDWTSEMVDDYLAQHRVPYNTLHDKGFVSIGCAPCTRAILPGENERDGRWWWENSKKECGLHNISPLVQRLAVS